VLLVKRSITHTSDWRTEPARPRLSIIVMPKHTRTHPSRPASPQPKKRRRSPLRVFQSAVYHTTFYLFIIIVGCLVVGSAYGLGEQAVQSGGQSRFNLFVMVAAYVVVVSSLSSHFDFFEE